MNSRSAPGCPAPMHPSTSAPLHRRGSGGAEVKGSHEELEVHRLAFEATLGIFEASKGSLREQTS